MTKRRLTTKKQIDHLLRSVRKHKSDKVKLRAKIRQLEKHIAKCVIARFSALGCQCGLYKKAKR